MRPDAKMFKKSFIMNSKVYILLLLLVINYLSWSQAYKATGNGVKSTVNSVDVAITFFDPSIVRITKSPAGNSFKKESLSVIKQPQKAAVSVKQQGDVLNVKSEILSINLHLKTGAISF